MRTGLKAIKVVPFDPDRDSKGNITDMWSKLRELVEKQTGKNVIATTDEPWRFFSTLVSDCTIVEKQWTPQLKVKQLTTTWLSKRRFGGASFFAGYKDECLVIVVKSN